MEFEVTAGVFSIRTMLQFTSPLLPWLQFMKVDFNWSNICNILLIGKLRLIPVQTDSIGLGHSQTNGHHLRTADDVRKAVTLFLMSTRKILGIHA